MQEILTQIVLIKAYIVNQDTTLVLSIFITLYVLGIPGMIRNLKREEWLEKRQKKGKRRR
jgi:hypothetical protein